MNPSTFRAKVRKKWEKIRLRSQLSSRIGETSSTVKPFYFSSRLGTWLYQSNTSLKRWRVLTRPQMKVFGVPVVGLKSILQARTNKPVTVIKRIPKQKIMAVQIRRPKRFPNPVPNPYTRSVDGLRSIYRYYKNQALLSEQPSESVYRYNYNTSRHGWYSPKWRELVKAGQNATTPYDVSGNYLLSEKLGSISCIYNVRLNASNPYLMKQSLDSSFANWLDLAPIPAHYSSGQDQAAQDQATRLLYQKIRSARHQLQGGVILGEIDKTARLLAGTAKNLKGGVWKYLSTAVGIRRGKGSLSSKRKALANSYLEATYGWQPLIMDCKDLAKTLGRLIHENDMVRFRVYAESTTQVAHVISERNYGFLYADITDIRATKTIVIYRGFLRGVPYEVGSPPLERIISLSGFDLGSFVPNLWELTPYSFLVDYFTNIGDCLYALTTDLSTVKALWRTQIKESTRSYRIVPNSGKSVAAIIAALSPNLKGNVTVEKQDGLITIVKRDVNRSSSVVPFIMVPALKGLDLPWRQFANIGALISGKAR